MQQSEEVQNFDYSNTQTINYNTIGYQKFLRTSPTINPKQDLFIMQIDIDYYIEKQTAIIRIYGVSQEGYSIQCHVKGFDSYFYVALPKDISGSPQNLKLIKQHLNKKGELICQKSECIKHISLVEKQSIRYYNDNKNKKTKFLKIYTYLPTYVSKFRKLIQQRNFSIQNQTFQGPTYQSNIAFALRYMIDRDIVGMGWLKVAANSYQIRHPQNKVSMCQIQIDCHADSIVNLTEDKWNKIAPLRLLSFDIQCDPQFGFPREDRDPVITIACVCKTSTDQTELKVVYTLKSCAPIPGVLVQSCQKQQDLLLKFQKLIKSYDPDFIMGYNIINFDFKYIIGRAQALKMKNYGHFGRSKNKISKISEGRYLSKAMGMRDTKQIAIEGRIQLDMMMHMHRDHKLSSYSLNNVSYLFLKQQKEDVHHSRIHYLQITSSQTRKRIAIYCIKDAQLPLKLFQKLMCLYNYTQMARVTGVPINYLFTRGQQIKVCSQLMRKAKLLDLIIPTQRVRGNNNDQVGFEGAYVLEPKSGFYKMPIATLDFASLYPSIMMAHNLCYTTLIHKADLDKFNLTKDDITETPEGFLFVKPHIKKGILPQILQQLISARKRAKLQLAKTTDEMIKAVLQGRQLALKISANSVYGFTGATVGQLPCLQISSSVTGFGRQMIDKTRKLVEEKYEGSEVIYGDTDSVMVKFKLNSDINNIDKKIMIIEAMKYGRQAASIISKQFLAPIKLQFQKVYCPYLLIAKKRYAGLMYTKPEQPDKLDKKGIQSVRRDNCLLIRQMLETVLTKVLRQDKIDDCVAYIKKTVSDLIQNKIDISSLVITKALSKKTQEQQQQEGKGKDTGKNTYKVKQAHVELAQKMRKRDVSATIGVGDRIPYVMIKGMKGSKNYQNAEDPIKVLNEDLPIDFDYYIEKQIKPPLQRLLKHTNIIPNFDPLFGGEHTKIRYIPKINKNSSLGKFFTIKSSCLNCPTPSEDAICNNCKPKGIDIYLGKIKEIEQLKSQFSQLWSECQRCQGSVMMEVLCQNMDCPIFYKRIKVRNEIVNREQVLKRFGSSW